MGQVTVPPLGGGMDRGGGVDKWGGGVHTSGRTKPKPTCMTCTFHTAQNQYIVHLGVRRVKCAQDVVRAVHSVECTPAQGLHRGSEQKTPAAICARGRRRKSRPPRCFECCRCPSLSCPVVVVRPSCARGLCPALGPRASLPSWGPPAGSLWAPCISLTIRPRANGPCHGSSFPEWGSIRKGAHCF